MDDYPLSGLLTDALSDQFKATRNLCISDGEVCNYRIGTYIFVPSSGCWLHLASDDAARYIASYLGMDNVTTNCGIAAKPYLSYAERIAGRARPIPLSVCIGSRRLRITPVDGRDFKSGIAFNTLTALTPHFKIGSPMVRPGGLCVSPVSISCLPKVQLAFPPSKLENMLSNTFTPQCMRLLRWVIGNSLVDPVSKSRAVYLYGRGGDGKCTAINAIMQNLPGTFHPLSKDYVGIKQTMSADDTVGAMTSRFISHSDVSLALYGPNAAFRKKITGDDTIKVPTGQGRLQCTGFFASNQF